jgi:hypothetical protein
MGLKIEKIVYEEPIPVYDITVPETESFIANDILVHNCSEIALSSTVDESFVCCLSSLNVLHYDEWKDTNLVADMVAFLDAVMEEYIEKTKYIPLMHNAHNFAMRQRAVGLGTLGWHSLLQSKMISFESNQAKVLNAEIHKNIFDAAEKSTVKLASLYGEPEMLRGYGRRNVTTCAIAPTTSCVTPDTEFLDAQGNPIDYYIFCNRGGLDLEDIMSIKIEYEDGTTEVMSYQDILELGADGGDILKLISTV